MKKKSKYLIFAFSIVFTIIGMSLWGGKVYSAGVIVSKESIEKCEKAAKNQLIAPLEAKKIYEYQSPTREGGQVFKQCFQARTLGGGFGQVVAFCYLAKDGSFIKSELIADTKTASIMCH